MLTLFKNASQNIDVGALCTCVYDHFAKLSAWFFLNGRSVTIVWPRFVTQFWSPVTFDNSMLGSRTGHCGPVFNKGQWRRWGAGLNFLIAHIRYQLSKMLEQA